MNANKHRLSVLLALVATIVVVKLPGYIPLLGLGDYLYPCTFLSLGLMAAFPFLLARIAPRAAGFDVQWLPRKWSHWAWFLGMVVLLFVCGAMSIPLVKFVPLKYTPPVLPPGLTPDCTFTAVILHGIILVLLCPIAEEIFYRGYLLEQLRKLMHSSVALLIQSLVFALAHLPLIIPSMGGYQGSIGAFLYGVVLGTWRIKFRSILPLILAHMILNGVCSIHILKSQYDFADSARILPPDSMAKIRSSPKCQQMYSLTSEPVEKAVPAIIGFFADPDKDVRTYAASILIECYRRDAEPYLKEALASKDKNVLNESLFVVGLSRYSGLQQEVREVAWSVDDQEVQFGTVMTLRALEDAEGLRNIAQTHPDEKMRQRAETMLELMEEKR